MTDIRRCTAQRDRLTHASVEARWIALYGFWDGRTLCGKIIRDAAGIETAVNCERCVTKLQELADVIRRCLEGDSAA